MFDIGFSELILIAIVALLVIGPERLPETIRVTTRWMRNIRRSFEQAKREVEQELGVDAIKRELHNEEILQALETAKGDLKKTEDMLSDTLHDAQHHDIHEKQLTDNNRVENTESTILPSAIISQKTP